MLNNLSWCRSALIHQKRRSMRTKVKTIKVQSMKIQMRKPTKKKKNQSKFSIN